MEANEPVVKKSEVGEEAESGQREKVKKRIPTEQTPKGTKKKKIDLKKGDGGSDA